MTRKPLALLAALSIAACGGGAGTSGQQAGDDGGGPAGDDGGTVTHPDAAPEGGGGPGTDGGTGPGRDAGADGSVPVPESACPLPTASDPVVGQQLPKVSVDTSWPKLGGKTIAVHAGGDLQAAINSAQPGDTISLDAGASFTGPFHLSAKTGTGWIVIESSAVASLPALGGRVGPTDVKSMATILVPDAGNAFVTDPDAQGYRIVGLEIAPANASTTGIYDMVLAGDPNQTSLDHVAHDLIFDRVYLHGTPTASIKRGIQMAGASVAVIGSWISDIHVVGQDSQAIGGFNGPGPYRIENNYLEASTENVLFGGADPTVPNLVPSDIEIIGNHFYKPLTWKSDDPSYAGTAWAVKNLLELKNAQRVLVACNVIENNWTMGQVGFAVLFTPRNQSGTAPWCDVTDVTFVHNVVRHSASAVNVLGTDNDNPSGTLQRVLVSDNVFYDIDGTKWDGAGMFLEVGAGAQALKVDHNTVLHTGNVISAYGTPETGFVFTNNVMPHNAYGVIGDSHAPGNDSIQTFVPSATFQRNAIVALPSGMTSASYPPDNLFPAAMTDVQFVNMASDDYRLQPTSPLHDQATDGTDIGANVTLIDKATAGVAQ